MVSVSRVQKSNVAKSTCEYKAAGICNLTRETIFKMILIRVRALLTFVLITGTL